MKELYTTTQFGDVSKTTSLSKKSKSFNSKQRSPTKTQPSTWKEIGKQHSEPILSTDLATEKNLKQQEFLAKKAPSVEILLAEEELLTPQSLLATTSTAPSSSQSSDEEPTKDTAPTNILELLAKKDNLKKIAASIDQVAPKTTTTSSSANKMPAASSTTASPNYSPLSPQKRIPKSKAASNNNSTKSPPRAPSPPTKQPKAKNSNTNSSNNNSRATSPSKTSSINGANSTTGTSSNNNGSGANNLSAELRFAGPAFHNSPLPSELPIPCDFFSGKNKDASAKAVKMPTNANNSMTLITSTPTTIAGSSPPTRDTITTNPPSSICVNFTKELPEFQVAPMQQPSRPVFPFSQPNAPVMAPLGYPPMMPVQMPMPPMQQVPFIVPLQHQLLQQPPVMLNQMSNQLKMMLNIAN